MADQVDLVSFHFFTPAADLREQYTALRAAVPDRPILMSEFGLPTWNSPFFPNGHTEAEQATYYADLLGALRATDSAGAIAWTLYDFSYVPRQVAGSMPWRVGPERQLGGIRADGARKPAAALLAPGAALDAPPVPGWARFLKPFWLLVFAVVGIGVLLSARLVVRRLSRRPAGAS